MIRFAIKNTLEDILDSLVERIIKMSDYFSVVQSLTLSEWIALLFNAAWATSFLFFHVKQSSPVFEYLISEDFWTCVFCALAIGHAFGIIRNSLKTRSFVATVYAINWFIWTVLTFYSRRSSPMWTTCLVLTLLSLTLAVRLKNEVIHITDGH